MAKKTKYIQVQEVKNAYEVVVLSSEVHTNLLEELDGALDMLFFQTRAHIQLNVSKLNYLPLPFLTKILQLARDLRLKKRVLVLVGLNRPSYQYFLRYGLLRLIFPNEGVVRNYSHLAKE